MANSGDAKCDENIQTSNSQQIKKRCRCQNIWPDDEENFIESLMPYITPLPDIKKMEVRIAIYEILCKEFEDPKVIENAQNYSQLPPSKKANIKNWDDVFFWGLIPLIRMLKPEKRLLVRTEVLSSIKEVIQYQNVASVCQPQEVAAVESHSKVQKQQETPQEQAQYHIHNLAQLDQKKPTDSEINHKSSIDSSNDEFQKSLLHPSSKNSIYSYKPYEVNTNCSPENSMHAQRPLLHVISSEAFPKNNCLAMSFRSVKLQSDSEKAQTGTDLERKWS